MCPNHTPEPTPTKQCNKCRAWKPATTAYFEPARGGKYLTRTCRDCTGVSQRILSPRPDGLKRCPRCNILKPATPEHFARAKAKRDGFCPHCKECQRAYQKSRAAIYREPESAGLIPFKVCTKCSKEYPWTPEFFNRNAGKPNGLSTWCKKCDTANSLRYQRANLLASRKRKEKWRKKNPGYHMDYLRKHPEKMREARVRRRILRVNAPGHHTAADVRRQYEAQKGKCYYCGRELGDSYDKDHVIPLSRGGSDGPENIVVACGPCNRSKGTKLPHEWDGSNRLL